MLFWGPEIRVLNLDIHQFSYSERLIHSKIHLKRSLCIELKEKPYLLRESPPKPKISLSNLDFHQFFYGERLFHPKRHLKGNCYMSFEDNRSSCFFKTRISKYSFDTVIVHKT